MVTAATLGDIVQQCGEVKRASRGDGRGDRRGEGQFVFELALFDLVQNADGEQGMLVDRVDMVHVVLHLRDDAAEIGDESAKHAGLVHPPQRGLGVLL